MSRFIKTTSGYLNQDHILLIRFGLTKEDEGHDLIQMSDGRIVQTQIEDFDWLGPKYAVDEENRRRALPACGRTMVAAPEPSRRGAGAGRRGDRGGARAGRGSRQRPHRYRVAAKIAARRPCRPRRRVSGG